MNRIIAIPVLLLCLTISQAAVLKVASDGTQPYNQISAAIAAASPNDTLVVMGGGYTGFTVDKKLVIIGAGTGMGIGEGVQVSGIVTVLDAADSTELRSLWIRASANSSQDSLASVLRIRSGATRIFVWRCFIENYYTTWNTACCWVGIGASADFVQCYFWYSGQSNSGAAYGLAYRSNATITLTSCAIVNCEHLLHSYSTTTGASAQVSHCLITTKSTLQVPFSGAITGVAENCVFFAEPGWGQSYGGSMSYSYCGYSAVAPPGATHVATLAAHFVNFQYEDARGADYHLISSADLIDAGNPSSPFDLDGSTADIGMYGGQHPYVEGGVPDYPFAVQVEVPYSAPLNGTMRIWGRGRVGPGN